MNTKAAVIHLVLTTAFLALVPISRGFPLDIPRPEIFLSTSGGLTIGTAKELVYNHDEIISELDWDLDPVVTLGLDADIRWKRALQLSTGIVAGLPGNCGSMTDSDYLNLSQNGSHAKTTFSSHDAVLKFSFDFFVKAGYEFEVTGPCGKKVSIIPSLGFRYITHKWDGKDGYMQHTTQDPVSKLYPELTESTPKENIRGTVISYQQNYSIPFAEIAMETKLTRKLGLTIALAGWPWIYCNAMDNHYQGTNQGSYVDFTDPPYSTDYYDYLSEGFMINPSAAVQYDITKRLQLFVNASVTVIGDLRGDMIKENSISKISTWYDKSNGGGASYTVSSVRLGVTTRF